MSDDLEQNRARLNEVWLAQVNELVAAGEDEVNVGETLLAMGLALAIAQDGHRATARNLYAAAVRMAAIADRNAEADQIARDEMLKAGLRLN